MDYTPDDEAKTEKRIELIAMARSELGALADHAETLIDKFADISPPQDPPLVLEMITVYQGGRGGGRTRKPGNIRLNWRKLFRDSPDLVLTGAGSLAEPWLIPLAALSIFNKLWTQATIELTKEQATCLLAMWHRCDEDHKINRSEAYTYCKEWFSVYKWPEPTEDQFSEIIRDLETLQCLEPQSEDQLWLREWVRNSYS